MFGGTNVKENAELCVALQAIADVETAILDLRERVQSLERFLDIEYNKNLPLAYMNRYPRSADVPSGHKKVADVVKRAIPDAPHIEWSPKRKFIPLVELSRRSIRRSPNA